MLWGYIIMSTYEDLRMARINYRLIQNGFENTHNWQSDYLKNREESWISATRCRTCNHGYPIHQFCGGPFLMTFEEEILQARNGFEKADKYNS